MNKYVAAAVVLLAGSTLSFGQIVVDSIDDDNGAGDCELREAIINANNDDQSGSTDCAAGAGYDTIDLAGVSGTIELGSALPAIVDSLSIGGPGADQLTIDANRTGRVFWVGSGFYLYISDVTITGGLETIGGGIYNLGGLTLSACVVTDNIADQGSGIYNNGGGTPGPLRGGLTILNSLVSDNHDPAETFGNGGGLNNSAGLVTIDRTTFSGNVSDVGGGILNWDRLVVSNSTFTGNVGENGGGGISLTLNASDEWSLIMTHSTVTKNESGSVGGGLSIGWSPGSDTSKVSLYSSIIADNDHDIYGPVYETRGYNILGRNPLSSGLVDGVNGDQVGTNASPIDPGLYLLASYGNLVPVHLPKPTSPALDNGSCSLDFLDYDQRGVFRPQDLDDGAYPNADDGCDVGAVELLEPELSGVLDFVGFVLLEGPYNGNGVKSMSVALNASLPTTQPFSDAAYNGTVLDYDGAESVVSVPPDAVDWVLVSLRTDVTPESEVPGSEKPAFVTDSGLIVGLDGDTLAFPVDQDPYYLVVRHRNHGSVMTSGPVTGFSSGLGEWDFTTSMAQAYTSGGNPMKSLPGGLFGMFAADGNADGQVTAPDFNLWIAATTAGATGYAASDYNMDAQVTAPDFNLWIANTTAGAASRVPD